MMRGSSPEGRAAAAATAACTWAARGPAAMASVTGAVARGQPGWMGKTWCLEARHHQVMGAQTQLGLAKR